MQRLLSEAVARIGRARRLPWVDLLLVLGLAGLAFAFFDLGREWTGVHRPSIAIDLSPSALPRYTMFSLFRGLLAYVVSLGSTNCSHSAATSADPAWCRPYHAASGVFTSKPRPT